MGDRGGRGWPRCPVPEQADVVIDVSPTLKLALRGRPLDADDRAGDGRPLPRGWARSSNAGDSPLPPRRRTSSQPATPYARLSWPRCRTTCARRSRVSRRRCRACAWPTCSGRRKTRPHCWRPSRSPPTGWSRSSNLLDLCRLQTGAVRPRAEETSADDLVARGSPALPGERNGERDRARRGAGRGRAPGGGTDPGLVERALANLVENALRHTRETPVLSTAIPSPSDWRSGSSTVVAASPTPRRLRCSRVPTPR